MASFKITLMMTVILVRYIWWSYFAVNLAESRVIESNHTVVCDLNVITGPNDVGKSQLLKEINKKLNKKEWRNGL